MSQNKKKGVIQRLFEISMIIALGGMVVFVFINAFMRYFIGSGFPESEELARFFFVWVVFLGIIAAYKEGGHVSITILTDLLPGVPKLIVQVLGRLVTCGVVLFLLYGGMIYLRQASTYNSPATNINFGVVAAALPVMCIGLLAVDIMNLVGKRRREGDPAGDTSTGEGE